MWYEIIDGVTIVHLDRPSRKSNTGYVGIHKRRDGAYQVCKGKHILGWPRSIDEAIALRAEADRRSKDGTFHAWLADLLKKRR